MYVKLKLKKQLQSQRSSDDHGIYAADKVADNSPDANPYETVEDKVVLDWIARLVPISLRKQQEVPNMIHICN
jgi:hypothetical protein